MMSFDETTPPTADDDNSISARFKRVAVPMLSFGTGFSLLLGGTAGGAMVYAKGDGLSTGMAISLVTGLIGGAIVFATFRKWPTLTQGDPVTPRTRRYSWAMVALITFALLLTLVFARPEGGSLANDLYSNGPLPTGIAVGAALLWLVGMPLLSAMTRRNMDEVEQGLLQFGECVGFRFLSVAAPVWWLGYRGGVLPQPDVMILFVAVLAVSATANLARRLA